VWLPKDTLAMYHHYADEGAMPFSLSGRVNNNVAIVGGIGFDVCDASEVGGKSVWFILGNSAPS